VPETPILPLQLFFASSYPIKDHHTTRLSLCNNNSSPYDSTSTIFQLGS
jgi:hypothetical protein